jgi:hypothetical protein
VRDLPRRHERLPAPATLTKLTADNETTIPEDAENGMQTDEPPASKMLDKEDSMDDKTYTMAHDTLIAATVPTHIAPAVDKKSNDRLRENER